MVATRTPTPAPSLAAASAVATNFISPHGVSLLNPTFGKHRGDVTTDGRNRAKHAADRRGGGGTHRSSALALAHLAHFAG
jgi:hypothetical protein